MVNKVILIGNVGADPERDLKTMKGDDLLSNVKLAYEARNRFAWAKSVPVLASD